MDTAHEFGMLRRLLVIVLPLATLVLPFFVAPALPVESVAAIQVVRVILTLAPVAALVAVPVLAYELSERASTAAWTTMFAFLVELVGGVIFMLAVWPSES